MIFGRLLGIGDGWRSEPEREPRAAPLPLIQIGGERGLVVQPADPEARPPRALALPWAEGLPEAGTAFEVSSLLSWRHRLAPDMVGRDAELAGLRAWAQTGRRVRLRVLSGPAGAGKSRLAASLALALPDWQAGIVPLAAGASVPLSGAGILIIIERPEAAPEAFRTLLREAARVDTVSLPVRILVLSRRPTRAWRQDITDCEAGELCAAPDLTLGPLPADAAIMLFRAAFRRAMAGREAIAPPSDAALSAWLALRPGLHGLPQMVQAAAIAWARGGDGVLAAGPDIMRALARMERDTLDRVAAAQGTSQGWTGRGASRLAGLAQLRDGLDPPAIRRLSAPALNVGMPPPDGAVAAVAALGWWALEDAPDPPPDLFAAALLRDVLDEAGDQAPAWLWAILGDRGVFHPELVARRADDWSALFDDDASGGLPAILAASLGGRPERADRWRVLIDAPEGEQRLALVAAAVGRGMLAQPKLADQMRASILNGISTRLWDGGDKPGAVAALREAVDLRQRMARANPGRFDIPLALALAALSNRLGDIGDAAGAVAAIGEAVALRRPLAAKDPGRFEPELAHCLGLLSSRLSEADQGDAALAAIEEATEIRRRLAQADPAKWDHDLSASLNALSIRRSDIGDRAGAMAATQEGVALRRRLARADPARHEPGLAQSLHNLAIRLTEVDDMPGALSSAQEAVSIRRRLAEAAPARFERDLTQSLQNLSSRLSGTGDHAGALTAIRECVVIRRRLVQATPGRFEGDLAEALVMLSQRLVDVGDRQAALPPMREAVAIRRQLAAENPARSQPHLALALHLLGSRLGALGAFGPARAAVEEAIGLRTSLAAQDAARYAPALAASNELMADLLAADPATE